eukprot:1156865-Pelagomonas_calceolata.AAC.12
MQAQRGRPCRGTAEPISGQNSGTQYSNYEGTSSIPFPGQIGITYWGSPKLITGQKDTPHPL